VVLPHRPTCGLICCTTFPPRSPSQRIRYHANRIVISRACDFFDLFLFSAFNQLYFKPPNKAVILSEALRRSTANRGIHSAESKSLS
jgi:hypothetical protein